jgi:hypothetical protein
VVLVLARTHQHLTDQIGPSGAIFPQGERILWRIEHCQGSIKSFRILCQDASGLDRFERAKEEGDLSKNVDADELARYLYTVCQGISVQAAWGATREQLHLVVDRALKQWPRFP